MAITEKPVTEGPLELESGTEALAERPLGVLTRPQGGRGWQDWLSTVDHKKIGIMYGVSAMVFFVVGGVEALLIRLQLAVPNGGVLSADVYNQVFTMHGVTMVFLFIMPLAAAFANYLIPLQIGARDVAFPAPQCAVLLDLAVRRDVLEQFLDRWRRRCRLRLVLLFAQQRPDFLAEPWRGLLCARPADRRICFADLGHQLDRHLSQYASARNGLVPHAGPHLDAADHPVLAAVRVAGHHCCAVLVDVRPAVRRHLLQSGRGGRSVVMAAPLLDIRAPGGLHHHSAGLRRCV